MALGNLIQNIGQFSRGLGSALGEAQIQNLQFDDPALYSQIMQDRQLGKLRKQELEERRADRASQMRLQREQAAQKQRMQQALGSLSPQLAQGLGLPQEAVSGLLGAGVPLNALGNLGQMINPAPEYMSAGGTIFQKTREGLQPVYRAPQKQQLTPEIINFQFTEKLREKYGDEMATRFGGGGGLSSSDEVKIEKDLRKEFVDNTKTYIDTRNAYQKILASDPTAAGDIGMIFAFMKMHDPTSVVREGEFATAQNAAGVPERVINIYNAALKGTRLSPEQRLDFQTQAGNIYQNQLRDANDIAQTYKGLAERANVDVDDVVINLGKKLDMPIRFTQENPAKPKTQAEFDKLPKGSYFIDDEGLKVK